jgi:hypothetical protein
MKETGMMINECNGLSSTSSLLQKYNAAYAKFKASQIVVDPLILVEYERIRYPQYSNILYS